MHERNGSEFSAFFFLSTFVQVSEHSVLKIKSLSSQLVSNRHPRSREQGYSTAFSRDHFMNHLR